MLSEVRNGWGRIWKRRSIHDTSRVVCQTLREDWEKSSDFNVDEAVRSFYVVPA